MKKSLIIAFLILNGFHSLCQTIKDTVKNDKEKILEIIYDESAGEGGQIVFRLTTDSIFYSSWSGDQKIYRKEKNTDKAWNDLVHSINLKRFDEIKSDKSNRDVDGADAQITIQTSKKKHFLITNYRSKNYLPIKGFLHKLLIEMKNYDKNINTEYY